MPDTFGKRQRDAAKLKRRETKEARRAARKSGQLYSEVPGPEAPFGGPAWDEARGPDDEGVEGPDEQP